MKHLLMNTRLIFILQCLKRATASQINHRPDEAAPGRLTTLDMQRKPMVYEIHAMIVQQIDQSGRRKILIKGL